MLHCLLVVAFALSAVATAAAQSTRVPIVRDAEIEALLADYAEPIMRVAGVKRNRTEIVLVNQRSFNAFVSGRKIFINVGAIVQAETPNEIIGVIAHEVGHLAGGHQDRLRQQIDRAQTIAAVTTVLGVGAAIAGGVSGNRQAAQAGGGIAAGGVEAAQRGLMSYRRSEELAADRAAVDYLNRTGQSAKGLLTTFVRFQRDISLIADRINPYKISHPLPRERLSALETIARQSPHFDKTDSAALQRRHDRARAKILAYVFGPGAVDDAFRDAPNSQAARYGKAISTFLYGSPRDAVPMIDRLIAESPSDPYLHEMKGEVLLRAQDAQGAVNAFSRAVQLTNGNAPTIQVALGHALVLAGGEANLRRAIGELEVAITLDTANTRAYQHLAMAYGRLGADGEAELATAEANFHAGRYDEARRFAARAKRRFERGAPQWLRADDIQRFRVPR
ncbi:M48 family metalloprotease [Roseitalea porphyridii]|uniref:M48 family peptidase n=1 Tax=Roseitalea porphyridii TaxID=1852022 RepID=A0A4P6V1E5_9HYPH|nr:M48 family metalloprotease [Roseitalea porphyridii]QBK30469.1 M48 family peptidase [Roseitalea porphyridii]